jgi:hypothetical protein
LSCVSRVLQLPTVKPEDAFTADCSRLRYNFAAICRFDVNRSEAHGISDWEEGTRE